MGRERLLRLMLTSQPQPVRLRERLVDSVLRLPLLLSSRLLPLCPRAEIMPELCRAAHPQRVGPNAGRPVRFPKPRPAGQAATILLPCYPAGPDALGR